MRFLVLALTSLSLSGAAFAVQRPGAAPKPATAPATAPAAAPAAAPSATPAPKAAKVKPMTATVTCSQGKVSLPAKSKPRLGETFSCVLKTKDARIQGGSVTFRTSWVEGDQGKQEPEEHLGNAAAEGSQFLYETSFSSGPDYSECSGPLDMVVRAVDSAGAQLFEKKLRFEQSCPD
jgi:pyruvate dehydrogenase E2 component (dihydrolipoamide acetyltransferase)